MSGLRHPSPTPIRWTCVMPGLEPGLYVVDCRLAIDARYALRLHLQRAGVMPWHATDRLQVEVYRTNGAKPVVVPAEGAKP